MPAIKFRIYGHVQGVFFRESMRQLALELDLAGWVRNRSDGSVEAVVAGDAEALARMREWASRGPQLARVERVVEEPADGEYVGFERWPSL